MKALFDEILAQIKGGNPPQVMLGPVCWSPGPDDTRKYYFIVGTFPPFRLMEIDGHDEANAVAGRAALTLGLMQCPPLLLHDFDSEYEMAKFCARAFPSPRTRQTLEDFERESGNFFG